MSIYSDYANALSRIEENRAQAQAQATANKSQLWGQTIATLGQVVPQQVQQAMQLAAQKKKTAQFQQAIQQAGGDLEKALPTLYGIDPKGAADLEKAHGEATKTAWEFKKLQQEYQEKTLDKALNLFSTANDQEGYDRGRYALHLAGYDDFVKQLPEDFEQGKSAVAQIAQSLVPPAQRNKEKELVPIPGPPLPTGQPGPPVYGEKVKGQPVYQAPKTDTNVTATELAMDAANPQSPTAQQSQAALNKLRELTPQQAASDARLQQQADEAARHNRAMEALSGQRNAQQQAVGQPIEIKPGTREYRIAKDLADGTLTFTEFNRLYSSRGANASQWRAAEYDLARQLNPEFNPSQFELGYKMAGNPQIRQRIVAITALGPIIDQISALADQVGNTDVPGFNKLLMGAKFQLGNKTVTNFRQLQTLLGDEVGMALGVGTGSDLKTKLGLDLVNPNLGPGQFKATMEQLRSVLESRRQALGAQMGPYAGAAGAATPPTSANPRDPLGIR